MTQSPSVNVSSPLAERRW